MLFVQLDDIVGFGAEVDETLKQWRKGIENANNVSVTGDVNWQGSGTDGYSLNIKRPKGGSFPAVATSIITAAPSDNKLGKGTCKLRVDGATSEDLVDGETGVEVFSNFRVSVPNGTRLMVSSRGPNQVWLMGADCPLS